MLERENARKRAWTIEQSGDDDADAAAVKQASHELDSRSSDVAVFLECGTGTENQATPNLEARLYFTRELFGMSPCIQVI